MSDPDRKKIVNDVFYSKIYSRDIWEPWIILDYANQKYINDGYHIPVVRQVDFTQISEKYRDKIKRVVEINNSFPHNFGMEFAGDADFNLKRFGNDTQTHALYNFSILPVRGGINRKKGSRSGYNEQLGLFLKGLEEYFRFREEKIDDEERKKKIEELFIQWGNTKDEYKDIILKSYIAYFDLYDSFYDYCDKVYLINKDTIGKIIGIEVNKDNYKTVSKIYWDNRKTRIKEIYKMSAIKEFDEHMAWDLGKDDFA